MELKAINPKAPEAAGPSSFALYLDSLLSWKKIIIKKQKRKKPGNREGRGWADRRREGKPETSWILTRETLGERRKESSQRYKKSSIVFLISC